MAGLSLSLTKKYWRIGMAESFKLGILDTFPAHTLQEWRAAVDKLLDGKPYEKVMQTTTYEGITLKPLYTKEDGQNLENQIGLPGIGDHVRGKDVIGYLQQPWLIAQEIGYPTVQECHDALQYDLARGLSAIHLVLDEASSQGLDPQKANEHQVGFGGVSIHSVADLEKLFQGITLDRPIMIQAGTSALSVVAMLLAYQLRQGAHKKLSGTIGLDPLGELARYGTLPVSLEQAYNEMAILTRFAISNAPQLRTIVVSSHVYHNSGAQSCDELAMLLATSAEYLFQMQQRGLDVDAVAPHIQWNLEVGSNFFMEIAKIRAARLLWVKLTETFKGSPASCKLTIHARGSSYNKTRYDVYVNMLRSTTEAFSAVLGGCQSLHVSYFDEAIRQSNEFSRRIARNQQIILQEECHLDRLIDPTGGSWYVESLTDSVAKESWKEFQKIAKQGGAAAVLQDGTFQAKITDTAKERRNNFTSRKEVVVGTNMYANVLETPLKNNALDYTAIRQARIQEVSSLNTLSQVIVRSGTEIADMTAAFAANATLGQVVAGLRAQAPNHTPAVKKCTIHRLAEPYEQLRDAMLAYKKQNGQSMRVFLLNMGPLDQHRARADFSRNFFEVAGFEVLDNLGFAQPQDGVAAALNSGAQVVVICSTDDSYPQLVPQLAPALKYKPTTEAEKTSAQSMPGTPLVILAGFPKEQVESHKKSGVDEFIHIRANAHQVLSDLMRKLGILASK